MNPFASLYSRLTLAMIVLFIGIGLAYLGLVSWSSKRYYQETTQSLNQSLGMYIADRAPLIRDGEVNHAAIQELAELVMVVNPIVEVYLIGASGKILAHAVSDEDISRDHVNLEPILAWLDQSRPLPITGTDPRSATGEKVFSAWPIEDQGETAGYLYVVLEGETYSSLRDTLSGSYALRLSLVGLAATFFFAALCAVTIFAVMTRPLRQLAREMVHFQATELQSAVPAEIKGDEIEGIRRTFETMKSRIREQMAQLAETDRVRRELISNVSHDLRTPLASMQGYLETLTVKSESISDTQRRSYLDIAYRHCLRLTRLVQDLFELSKLDAGNTPPQMERFSLAELLQDVAQKFTLSARKKNVQLQVQPVGDLCEVTADIALIERVIENLIVNAIHYTPEGGFINLSLNSSRESVQVQIADTGNGVPAEEIPRIFERYYRARVQRKNALDSAGTGLGLAIVKRILDLHQCRIEVVSEPGAGTCFQFELPRRSARLG